ncbi:HAMP domain-containing sensor histidine kinase [Marinilabiliaceae bacterium ANBcel2]|nr:HAMP domain-containing sensor histidine kinase [Marinilabiliaceae bacterium ANBcel2]
MKIRNKILIYFSTTMILLTAISFTIIYILFSNYRAEEFLQQQNKRIQTTLKLLTEVVQDGENIQETMDVLTVYDFYDEKLLIFDENKQLIYRSKEDIPDPDIDEILPLLSQDNEWIKRKEGKYNVIGTHIIKDNKSFYAISKAYDDFGFTKLFYLGNVLIGIFLFIAAIVIFVAHFLTTKISKPLTILTNKLKSFKLGSKTDKELAIETSTYEIEQLTKRFKELLNRANDAFDFQKHTIHHISHQLKTPIAVIVSELEKIEQYNNVEDIKPAIQNQTVKVKSLGNIINILLEISKIETGQIVQKENCRIDEIIFDVIDELNIIYPDFSFEVYYEPESFDENRLIIHANPMLIRQVFQNLLCNCATYSDQLKAQIKINCANYKATKVSVINVGKPISGKEEKLLFNHFFRGKNSENRAGFGLGLVLTKKIVALCDATITYSNPKENLNIFELTYPLR